MAFCFVVASMDLAERHNLAKLPMQYPPTSLVHFVLS
jgi:hypothetical protein